MFWHTFTADQPALLEQYSQSNWNESSGESPAAIKAACEQIEREMSGQSRGCIKAHQLAYILKHAQLEILPCEWLADKINHAGILPGFRQIWKTEIDKGPLHDLLQETAAGLAAKAYSGNEDFSHTAPDWPRILQLGFPDILQRIRDARNAQAAAGSLTAEQQDFYANGELVWQSVIVLLQRLAAEAGRLAAQYPKQALVAQNLDQLARRAPATLLEALQFIILVYTLQSEVEGINVRSLGGLDRLLYPYYRSDLADGRLTREQAAELLQYFMTKLRAKRFGANIPFYLSGMDSEGRDTTNELSDLIIETYAQLNYHDPKIQVRVHDGTPPAFLRSVLRCIRDGRNSIALMNDPIVIGGLTKIGISLPDARNYVPIGCYEPCALGKEVPCTCNGIINLPKAVELALNNGCDPLTGQQVGQATGSAGSLHTFAEFQTAVQKQLRYFTERSMARIIAYERLYPQLCPSPLFSAMLDECVERGVDVYSGGAKYNNSSINVIGIATAVDALMAIKRMVYDESTISLADLRDILLADWSGQEKLRLQCLKQLPKYGNGLPEVDQLAADLAAFAGACINNQPNGRGGVFRCGLFSIDWYVDFGRHTGATPDGRRARDPLSKNLCATVAQDKAGVTALIHSVTQIDCTNVPNGSVLDILLHPAVVQGERGLDTLMGITEVYRKMGGFAIHFNIFDAQVLRDAQKNPAKYATLQVRVCGWNAYFVNLSRIEQDLFIQQAEQVKA